MFSDRVSTNERKKAVLRQEAEEGQLVPLGQLLSLLVRAGLVIHLGKVGRGDLDDPYHLLENPVWRRNALTRWTVSVYDLGILCFSRYV